MKKKIAQNVRFGLEQKLTAPNDHKKSVEPTTLREYFLAQAMHKFVDQVPEFNKLVTVFVAEGGFQENAQFSFDKLFQAIDHGAIRGHPAFIKNIPQALQPFGMKTYDPSISQYQFIPTGKPLDANYYAGKNGHPFKLFVSKLRLDLLPEDIQERVLDYIKLSFNIFEGRIAELATQAIQQRLTHEEGIEYANLMVHHLFARKKDAPELVNYDHELYHLLKKSVPEIFNALVFGPHINHLAIDLRKSGVGRWGADDKDFRGGIDRFFDEIGKTGEHGRKDTGTQRWGFDTLDAVQGNIHDESVKIRQTSVKMAKQQGDTCCYVEFVTRCPQKSTFEIAHDYATTLRRTCYSDYQMLYEQPLSDESLMAKYEREKPDMSFEQFVGYHRRLEVFSKNFKALTGSSEEFEKLVTSQPVYEGFHTYNATNIYTSNRSDDAHMHQKQTSCDENMLRTEIALNIEQARKEFGNGIYSKSGE